MGTATIVTTKEELDALRKELAKQRQQNESATPPAGANEPGRPTSWSDDRDALVQFLQDLREIMRYLIENRVPEAPRALFQQCFPPIETGIDIAITELKGIDSDHHPLFVRLRNAEVTGAPGHLKVREFWRRIATSPAAKVLKMADRILGSLFPILISLEPVKEFKETLEDRIENDGDAGLQSLNLSGNEQWWKSAP